MPSEPKIDPLESDAAWSMVSRSFASLHGAAIGRHTSSLALTLLSLLSVGLWWTWAPVIEWTMQPVAKVLTGGLLLAWLLALWMLFLTRAGRDSLEIKAWHRVHRWAGASICFALILHARTVGHGATATLAVVLLATVLVGCFNRETVAIRSRYFWTCWTVTKVALSMTLLALLALHVYVSLRYH